MFRFFPLIFLSSAFAHSGHEHREPSVFKLKWAWDPTLLFFLVMTFFYIRGLRAFNNRGPVAAWQKLFFFFGVFTLALASLPPVDTYADQLFSAHMIQHLLIISVGVPFIIMGAPFFVTLRGLPTGFRRRLILPLLQSTTFKRGSRFLQKPLVAALIYESVFWFWHLPYFYNLALLNDAIHLLEHACMALAAMNLWRIIIDPNPLRSRTPIALRVGLIGVMMTLDTALSAALTYSQHVWYAYDRLPLPAGWSGDRLQDQRLGGLIMWVPGSFIWITAIICLVFVWARNESVRETVRTDAGFIDQTEF